MARKEFEQFEAVSAVVPVQMGVAGAYHAAIAVKALYEGGAPRFHTVSNEQVFATATAADAAAQEQLERLRDVTADGELVW